MLYPKQTQQNEGKTTVGYDRLQEWLQELADFAHAEGGLERLTEALKAGLSRELLLLLIKQLL